MPTIKRMIVAPNRWIMVSVPLACASAVAGMQRGPEAPPSWLVFAMLAPAVAVTALAVQAAVRVGEWAPAAVAAGVMAAAAGLAVQPLTERPILVPALVLAAACYSLASLPMAPVRNGGRRPVLLALVAAPLVVLGAMGGIALLAGSPPMAVRAGIAGYGAGLAFVTALHAIAAFRLLRVPAWWVQAVGVLGLAGGLVFMASGVAVAGPLTAGVALLPGVAIVIEARQRPGLRTYVLGGALGGRLNGRAAKSPARAERALMETLTAYSPDLAAHLQRTAAMAVRLGRELGLEGDRLETLRRAALFHDVGKLFVPVHVLDRHGRPKVRDWEHLHAHPAMGQALIARVPALAATAAAVGDHHERYDGTGYPSGKRGAAIDVLARILTLADVYDALVSDRAYKAGWPHEDAVRHICEGSGTHFDPAIARVFLAMLARDGEAAEAERRCRDAAA